jgi:hypothetical protein
MVALRVRPKWGHKAGTPEPLFGPGTESANGSWSYPELHDTSLSPPHYSRRLNRAQPPNTHLTSGPMADFSELFPSDEPAPQDVDMTGGQPVVEISANAEGQGQSEQVEQTEDAENGLASAEGAAEEEAPPPRVTYIDHLKSPIVTLLVGQGEEQAILTAHENLLIQSPWFAETCAKFSSEFTVSLFRPLLQPQSNQPLFRTAAST